MANKKITELDEHIEPVDTDVLPIVGDVPTTPVSKKITWANIVIALKRLISVGSGGFSANVYSSNVDSEVSGYKKLSYDLDASETEKSIVVNNNTVTGETDLYDDGIEVELLPNGAWRAVIYAKVDSTIGDTKLKIQAFLRHADTSETDLFEMESETIENTADYVRFVIESSQVSFSSVVTDRFGIRIKGATTRTSNTTINYIVGGSRGCYINTTLPIRHNQLRDRDIAACHPVASITDAVGRRISAAASGATLTPEPDTYDIFERTAQAENLTIANHSTSTPADGQRMKFRLKNDGTLRTITFGNMYRGINAVLPDTLRVGETLYMDFVWNAADSKWDYVKIQGEKEIQLKICDDATALTTGDGKLIFVIPASMNGMNLIGVAAMVSTVSSSGAPDIQIRNVTDTQDMLSTKLTIDATEFTSYTAATPAVIDTTKDDVATGDRIAIDVDGAGTGAKGLTIYLRFKLP